VSALGAARTFQNIRLFKALSAIDNLTVAMNRERGYGLLAAFFQSSQMRAREEAMRHEALSILKTLGLESYAHFKAGSLPYGIQRKLEIARALASKPKLLLLDEPAAGMNPTETAELAKLICEIQKQFHVTILLIEHDMSLVMKICQRIYVLDYGELIAQGTPDEIKANPRVIEAYLGGAIGDPMGDPTGEKNSGEAPL
jgi:branched-chain amino acid transport system ATP-binding protein